MKIIKPAALLWLSLCCTTQLFAFGKNSTVGIEAGPVRTNVTGSEALRVLRPALRASAGISLQYNISKRLSLRGIASYERKGALAPNTIVILDSLGTSTGEVTPHINLDYLAMPLLLQYTLGRRYLKYYGCIGPYVGYLVRRTEVITGENIKPMVMYEGKDFDKDWDLGLSMGVGAQLSLFKNMGLSLELRNNLGVHNIIKTPATGITTVKNRSTGILLGLRYSL